VAAAAAMEKEKGERYLPRKMISLISLCRRRGGQWREEEREEWKIVSGHS